MLGFNIFPIIIRLFNLLPNSWRKSMMSKQNAPKPGVVLKDIFDLTGESPYEKEEVVPGKVWAVTYRFEEAGVTRESSKLRMFVVRLSSGSLLLYSLRRLLRLDFHLAYD